MRCDAKVALEMFVMNAPQDTELAVLQSNMLLCQKAALVTGISAHASCIGYAVATTAMSCMNTSEQQPPLMAAVSCT
jgi:hypothetical protein